MDIAIKKFYTVLVIAIDMFQSKIIDERHFSSKEMASCFMSTLNDSEYVTVMVEV